MFGRNGVGYLVREREIVAGRYRKRKTYRRLVLSLQISGFFLVVLGGVIAARLVQ